MTPEPDLDAVTPLHELVGGPDRQMRVHPDAPAHASDPAKERRAVDVSRAVQEVETDG